VFAAQRADPRLLGQEMLEIVIPHRRVDRALRDMLERLGSTEHGLQVPAGLARGGRLDPPDREQGAADVVDSDLVDGLAVERLGIDVALAWLSLNDLLL